MAGPISMKELLDSGAHFGHQTHRWNPKMKPYIFGARNGVHIIDLQQTVRLFKKAYEYIVETVAGGEAVLFVGTKRQSQEIIIEEAERAGQYYLTNRWLGGTLTNFRTIKQSVERYNELVKMSEEGNFRVKTKKEALSKEKEKTKLARNLIGIAKMTKHPGALFVVDPHKEQIAVKEANILGIPVIAICDTNCDPDGVDYVIPGNDDAIRAIKLFISRIADACLEGQSKFKEQGRSRDSQRSSDDKAAAHKGGPVKIIKPRRDDRRAFTGDEFGKDKDKDE